MSHCASRRIPRGRPDAERDGWIDAVVDSTDEAVALVTDAVSARRPYSVALVANAADAFPALLQSGLPADVVTDQTSAHDPLNGYLPNDLSVAAAATLRTENPQEYVRRSRASMARHCEAMVGFLKAGAEVFDYGNNLRGEAVAGGYSDAFSYPGFVPAYLRPIFCEGKGPFRWVALSGDPADIHATDQRVVEGVSRRPCAPALATARSREGAVPGLARTDLLARLRGEGPGRSPVQRSRGERRGEGSDRHRERPSRLGLCRIAVPRDRGHGRRVRRDCRLADPERLAECLLGGHLGGRASRGRDGIGTSIHAGAQLVVDGTPDAAHRAELMLTNDPGTGVMRHADAGYAEAANFARRHGIRLPMLDA